MSESKQVVSQQEQEMTSIQEFIGRNAGTMVKLSVFSAALFAFPIVTFFCTLHSLFDGLYMYMYVYVFTCIDNNDDDR